MESAKPCGLRGNMRYVGASVPWVFRLPGSNFYVGYMGSMGLNFIYVGHNFYVVCVGRIYFCVGQLFYVSQHFLSEVKFFCEGLSFCVGQFNWCFNNNILVIHYIRIEDMLNQHPISCNSSFT